MGERPHRQNRQGIAYGISTVTLQPSANRINPDNVLTFHAKLLVKHQFVCSHVNESLGVAQLPAWHFTISKLCAQIISSRRAWGQAGRRRETRGGSTVARL